MLERCDVARDRGLRYAEPVGRTDEVTILRRSEEDLQLT